MRIIRTWSKLRIEIADCPVIFWETGSLITPFLSRLRVDVVESNHESLRSFPLSMTVEGDRVRIVMHRGGQGLDKRLASMGLHIDSRIEILQRLGGSFVVAVNDIRLALGAGMAHKIMVVPVS